MTRYYRYVPDLTRRDGTPLAERLGRVQQPERPPSEAGALLDVHTSGVYAEVLAKEAQQRCAGA